MNFATRKVRHAPSIVERFAHEAEQIATALRCLADVGEDGAIDPGDIRAEADRLDLARRAFAADLAKHDVTLGGGTTL